MAKQRLAVTLLIILAYALLITGCGVDKAELEKAKAQAAKAGVALAKAETELANARPVLTKAKRDLATAHEENTKLKTQIGDMAKMFEDVRTELQTAKRAGDKLQAVGMKVAELEVKITVLTKDRDASAAKIKQAEATVIKLLDQLKKQAEEAANLKEHNRKLQATIEQLKEAGGWD
jgi:chromosome segregation ATPase